MRTYHQHRQCCGLEDTFSHTSHNPACNSATAMCCHGENIAVVLSRASHLLFRGGHDGLCDILSKRYGPRHQEVEVARLPHQALSHTLQVLLCLFRRLGFMVRGYTVAKKYI